MTTKPPSQVKTFPEDSFEKIAYAIAFEIKTREFNDNNRLGYHIWRYINGTIPTIDEAVRVSGVRLAEGETLQNVIDHVATRLKEKGIDVKREE